jgi:tRNA nucleotidyltransferase (CCA-adding enzyme)
LTEVNADRVRHEVQVTITGSVVNVLDKTMGGVKSGAVARSASPSPAARWEHFEHDADIGVRGYGPTVEVAFEQAALPLSAVAIDPGQVARQRSVDIACEAPSLELLLIDWLNALVLRMATDGLVFRTFEVKISGNRLEGRAVGEPIDVERHEPAVEVKGVTLTELQVARQADGSWRAQCVVDV